MSHPITEERPAAHGDALNLLRTVVAEAVKVLDAVTAGTDRTFEKTYFSLGATRFLETGDVLTDDDLAAIKQHDAILLGAVGGALTGRAIERASNRQVRYDVVLRLPNGASQVHSYDSPPPVRVGDVVPVPAVTYARAPGLNRPD